MSGKDKNDPGEVDVLTLVSHLRSHLDVFDSSRDSLDVPVGSRAMGFVRAVRDIVEEHENASRAVSGREGEMSNVGGEESDPHFNLHGLYAFLHARLIALGKALAAARFHTGSATHARELELYENCVADIREVESRLGRFLELE